MIPEVSEHAEQRAIERTGRAPTITEWRELVWQIVDGRALLVHHDASKGRNTYLVLLCGKPVRVLWQVRPGIIVTVMPQAREKSLKAIPRRVNDHFNRGPSRRPEQPQDIDA